MDNINEQLKDINAIRKMMEQSNKFISLSGLSGVIGGVAALAGAALAKYKMANDYHNNLIETVWTPFFMGNLEYYSFYVLDALIVLAVAIGAGILPTIARAKKKKQNIFNPTAYRMFINLFIPIIAGGAFCLVLINYSLFGLLAPCMLIFYGLALINASHYTINDIRYLGYIEIGLGLINCLYPGKGIYFLAFGFGVMHIVYGLFIYFKYERGN
ncbi:MAG: hypothetical protein ACKVQB_07955 [Bacteroidia bacterium]